MKFFLMIAMIMILISVAVTLPVNAGAPAPPGPGPGPSPDPGPGPSPGPGPGPGPAPGPDPGPGSSAGQNGGGLTPMCPFCGHLVYYDVQIKQTHRKHWLFGFDIFDWTLYCDNCGYTTERDAMGNIKNPVTKEAQAEWGARSWPINQKK